MEDMSKGADGKEALEGSEPVCGSQMSEAMAPRRGEACWGLKRGREPEDVGSRKTHLGSNKKKCLEE